MTEYKADISRIGARVFGKKRISQNLNKCKHIERPAQRQNQNNIDPWKEDDLSVPIRSKIRVKRGKSKVVNIFDQCRKRDTGRQEEEQS